MVLSGRVEFVETGLQGSDSASQGFIGIGSGCAFSTECLHVSCQALNDVLLLMGNTSQQVNPGVCAVDVVKQQVMCAVHVVECVQVLSCDGSPVRHAAFSRFGTGGQSLDGLFVFAREDAHRSRSFPSILAIWRMQRCMRSRSCSKSLRRISS